MRRSVMAQPSIRALAGLTTPGCMPVSHLPKLELAASTHCAAQVPAQAARRAALQLAQDSAEPSRPIAVVADAALTGALSSHWLPLLMFISPFPIRL